MDLCVARVPPVKLVEDRIFAGLNIARSPDQLSPPPMALDVL